MSRCRSCLRRIGQRAIAVLSVGEDALVLKIDTDKGEVQYPVTGWLTWSDGSTDPMVLVGNRPQKACCLIGERPYRIEEWQPEPVRVSTVAGVLARSDAKRWDRA